MKRLKLSLSAALALVALLLMAWVAQATPIGGPIGDARAEIRDLQEQFTEFVNSLDELDLELFNNQDQNDTGEKGLIDLIDDAIGVVDNNADAWTDIQFIDAAITLRNRLMTNNFNEIQTLISQIMENVGELQGKIEGLIEAGKIRLLRGQKIQRKLDTVSSDVTIIQDTFTALEGKIEDGDEGEEGCETTGRTDNCLDDVGDFLTLAEDTVSADPFSFDSKTVVSAQHDRQRAAQVAERS
ncbi:hypothetical protein HY230_01745 [Candidatus Acetothermia bacterium]|nr:hypothetical protein [Candidatus Acetothermia bacterium]